MKNTTSGDAPVRKSDIVELQAFLEKRFDTIETRFAEQDERFDVIDRQFQVVLKHLKGAIDEVDEKVKEQDAPAQQAAIFTMDRRLRTVEKHLGIAV